MYFSIKMKAIFAELKRIVYFYLFFREMFISNQFSLFMMDENRLDFVQSPREVGINNVSVHL